MGGDVTIAQTPGGHLRLTAKASRVTLDPALWSVLHFGMHAAARPLKACEAQFAALHATLSLFDLTLNFVAGDDGLIIATA
jgi:hypothetical protein